MIQYWPIKRRIFSMTGASPIRLIYADCVDGDCKTEAGCNGNGVRRRQLRKGEEKLPLSSGDASPHPY